MAKSILPVIVGIIVGGLSPIQYPLDNIKKRSHGADPDDGKSALGLA
ncbi:MAG: hypothetical protein ACR2F1_07325 [Nitrososphaeraceae archaeon]